MPKHLLIVIFCIPSLCFAQDGDYSLGASSSGMADASVATVNSWSLFNNPGASGTLDYSTAMVSYQNRYNLEGFHVIGGGALIHFKVVNIGCKYFKFGDNLFSQQLVGISLSNKFQMVSLGGGVNVIQTHAEGFKDDRVWVGEFGGLANITQKISFGAHIFNFKHGVEYPTTMKAGFRIEPLNQIGLNCEVQKQLEQREMVKVGLEYALLEFLIVRTGVNLQGLEDKSRTSTHAAFGFSIQSTGFLMDYSFNSGELGIIHEISLALSFGDSE